MTRRIKLNFSHLFNGVIWNTVLNGDSGVLLVEVRDVDSQQVSFSALDCKDGSLIWTNKVFDEPWWTTLSALLGDVAVFTIYLQTDNPDKKGIFAYHIRDQKVLWWHNDFSLVSTQQDHVIGVSMKYGLRNLALDVDTGMERPAPTDSNPVSDMVVRPLQYTDDHAYFSTVKTFLASNFNLTPVIALEYLEYGSLIVISLYVQPAELVNYLLVLSVDGELLLKEKLDEHLKGIGLDTFFIFEGCVFFVKNKRELFSYKIV